ncbi:hypothetical protein [Streptomyces chrestomyceticus]|uniref:hypothetical protein n=1 Tax=Streptomyces chrestomyceticus TaxID=68185 RepID=UPI0033C3F69F
MTAASGMVVHIAHSAGEHIIHYHCDKTDGRQHEKHFAVIPKGYRFLGTTDVHGAEYMPFEGGRKRADIYERTHSA